jgi:hypothetical protein
MLAFGFTACSATDQVASESAPVSGQASDIPNQDAHDDRPDDASSVGGDNSTATTSISAEARAWADANGFDLSAFENYAAPAAHEPTEEDLYAFKAWMEGGSNPRNQVMKQIQAAAGEEIANELWNYCNTIWKGWMNTANVGSVVSQAAGLKNVGAMQEGMFAGYFGSLIPADTGQDDYSSAALLVKDGFVVSSDGVTYRLHNISDGTVAYEMEAPATPTVSMDQFPTGLTDFTQYLPLETQSVTDEAKALLKLYASAGSAQEPSGVDRDVYEAAAQYVNTEFGEYYGQCPGPTVVKGIEAEGVELDSATEDTVGSSVGEKEFVASYFGVDSAAASLWKLGFLPSFDGTTYRLHSGKDGTVVYEISKDDINTIPDEAATSGDWIPFAIGGAVLVGTAVCVITLVVRKRRNPDPDPGQN